MAIGLLATTAIGALQGTIIVRLRLPSFVVTLAGLLGWEGVLIYLVNGQNSGGTIMRYKWRWTCGCGCGEAAIALSRP